MLHTDLSFLESLLTLITYFPAVIQDDTVKRKVMSTPKSHSSQTFGPFRATEIPWWNCPLSTKEVGRNVSSAYMCRHDLV